MASTFSFTETYASGVEQAQTEEFGSSLTVSATAGYDATSLGVEQAITQSFGQSVTISKTTTRQESFQMTNATHTTALFEVWTLTEVYSFVNEDGTPFEHPNFRFDPFGLLVRRDAGPTARTTSEFPLS